MFADFSNDQQRPAEHKLLKLLQLFGDLLSAYSEEEFPHQVCFHQSTPDLIYTPSWFASTTMLRAFVLFVAAQTATAYVLGARAHGLTPARSAVTMEVSFVDHCTCDTRERARPLYPPSPHTPLHTLTPLSCCCAQAPVDNAMEYAIKAQKEREAKAAAAKALASASAEERAAAAAKAQAEADAAKAAKAAEAEAKKAAAAEKAAAASATAQQRLQKEQEAVPALDAAAKAALEAAGL